MNCKDCKFYEPECFYSEGDPERWKKWGNCKNPKLDISGDIINAGADDDYGAFWHMTADFGCILFEAKEAKPAQIGSQIRPYPKEERPLEWEE